MEGEIKAWHQEDAASVRLATIPGIGPLTASALSATIGDARDFKSGRQLAAWVGLVPRQHSTGGKANLLGITETVQEGELHTLLTIRKQFETASCGGFHTTSHTASSLRRTTRIAFSASCWSVPKSKTCLFSRKGICRATLRGA